MKICYFLCNSFELEPGYYEDGLFGIRIEDIVQIVPSKAPFDFKGRGALTFKTLTMCPKQTKLIKVEMLLPNEVSLRNYFYYNCH